MKTYEIMLRLTSKLEPTDAEELALELSRCASTCLPARR